MMESSLKRLLGYACHCASVRLHNTARKCFELGDDECDDMHIAPDFALDERWVPVYGDGGCHVDGECIPVWGVTLADVAPCLAKAINAARRIKDRI